MDELEQLKRDNEVLYRDNVALSEVADALRSRAEAAEATINECLKVFREKVHHETTNLVPAIHHIIEERAYWRDRADAAEAEAESRRNQVVTGIYDAASVGIALIKTDELNRIQAEVARMKEKAFPQKAWHCDYCGEVVEGGCYHDCKEQVIVPKLRARIAELDAAMSHISYLDPERAAILDAIEIATQALRGEVEK